MDSYVVRVYRRGPGRARRLVGVVERIGAPGQRSFHDLESLWSILSTRAPRPRRPGPRGTRRTAVTRGLILAVLGASIITSSAARATTIVNTINAECRQQNPTPGPGYERCVAARVAQLDGEIQEITSAFQRIRTDYEGRHEPGDYYRMAARSCEETKLARLYLERQIGAVKTLESRLRDRVTLKAMALAERDTDLGRRPAVGPSPDDARRLRAVQVFVTDLVRAGPVDHCGGETPERAVTSPAAPPPRGREMTAEPVPGGIRFRNPSIDGVPLDQCWEPGDFARCQQPKVAREFCRRQGYAATAGYHSGEGQPPTKYIGSGEICRQRCMPYTTIFCSGPPAEGTRR